MNELTFIQLEKDNRQQFDLAKALRLPFIKELRAHEGTEQADEEILSGLRKRIHIQGSRPDMHFELALLQEEAVGIAMFAVDLGTIYGLLDEPGYGTVMGFYIKPEHRRKGLGRAFFSHIQTVLRQDGARKLYVCPDAVTGVPFWTAMGFSHSGKFDPDDKKPIYILDRSEKIPSPAK